VLSALSDFERPRATHRGPHQHPSLPDRSDPIMARDDGVLDTKRAVCTTGVGLIRPIVRAISST